QQPAPLGDRAGVIADEDRAAAGIVAQLAGQLGLRALDEPAPGRDELRLRIVRGRRPRLVHREHRRALQIRGEHGVGVTRRRGAIRRSLERLAAQRQPCDGAALHVDADFATLRAGARSECEGDRDDGEPDERVVRAMCGHGPVYSKPKWMPRSEPAYPSGRGGSCSVMVTARMAESSKMSLPLPTSTRSAEIAPERATRK